jgi:hypothetical protein
MESKFNKQTSDGLYTFNGSEVFEALTMWCAKKGITLDKNTLKSFRTVHNEVEGFVVELAFNGKEVNNATPTQKPTP